MRIGQFGKVNEISIDAIRHYMDLGLIVPEKQGGHYYFDENCQNDLELILELKGMGFQLNEIKMIFHYKNLGKFTDYERDAFYQSLFMDKHEKLEYEIKSLKDMQDRLQQKLDQLTTPSSESCHTIGIDLSLLDIFRCNKCAKSLTLQDGIIRNNQIDEGKLTCHCDQVYLIESGILRVGQTGQTIVSNDQVSHLNNIPEYIQETDPLYLENMNKGLHWSKRKLGQIDLHKKVILELGSGFGFFLRNMYQELPDDCLYIAVDHNLERHQFLKSLLERTGSKRNLLFICGDFLDIPISKQTVDIVIDHSGTSNYSFEHEAFLLREVDSLIKLDGYLLGSYLAFKNFSHKSKIEANYRDNFTDSKIKQNIRKLGYIPIEERTSESIEKGGKYEDFFVQGEEIFSYSFFGKR
ncbi:DNA-binding transcriptional MerR regulator/predicted O-methyltransferase YrrM [Bacillus sp. SLBN-46]|uniref:MerR family transcriptional regulator n=1 Tax=Bacillus sp. SLBN-46 TaxID=3042283 RepID=UPI002857B1D2|nr:MerR family transcriptional regulator [Bacillus sp. SLBN-46]MDR6125261.1 DNA-binding transcriptional MerR regulator/predicted O-methyltransferase YrrM [Bacillus sp. SLBN-46]